MYWGKGHVKAVQAMCIMACCHLTHALHRWALKSLIRSSLRQRCRNWECNLQRLSMLGMTGGELPSPSFGPIK